MLDDFETQAALMPGIDDGVKNYSFGPETFEVRTGTGQGSMRFDKSDPKIGVMGLGFGGIAGLGRKAYFYSD